jgi:NAD-dependent SIR2 family protein deacetylase
LVRQSAFAFLIARFSKGAAGVTGAGLATRHGLQTYRRNSATVVME